MASKTNQPKNRFSNISQKFASEGLVYILLSGILVASYALLVSGFSVLLFGVTRPVNPVLAGIFAFGLALAILPLRKRLIILLDSVFHRGTHGYQHSIELFSSDIENLLKIDDIIKSLRNQLITQISPQTLHVYYFDSIHEQYLASPDERGNPSSELRFSATSPIVRMLLERQGAIFLSGTVYEKRMLQTDRTRLTLLGATLVYPILRANQLLGWVAFGRLMEHSAFQSKDLDYIDNMCRLAGRAMERTRVITNLEERVRHLNVLTRVSQGINITIHRDDILELIYAQTTQLIPASDLSILVLDRATQTYVQVFCVRSDERLGTEENKRVDIENQLEQIVLFSQKPFLTNHFERECAKRGIQPYTGDLSAWLSVPLLSGAEIIGALSVGRRDLDGVYTRSQVSMLEAIADQVAGALEKSRLLTETERRAQQLSSLNEISRKLTSNLDFNSLLNNILQSAVQILLCDAGVLYLYDESTNELTLQASDGCEKDILRRKIVPHPSGIAGRVLLSGSPIRTRDAQDIHTEQPALFAGDEEQFSAALAVPLILKETILGVIQIMNKVDRSLFTGEDEELLMAFSAQASISIENARLYTQTDQMLEARVRELSVLQRVGRELNATLDSKQALNVTLNWAMAQSGLEAGFVGMLEGGGLKIYASSGYEKSLDLDEEGLLAGENAALHQLIHSGKAQIYRVSSNNSAGFLPDASQQIFVPIERENVCTGMLVLETRDDTRVHPDLLTFLQRLIDHASISIANAQLYSAVQKANVAKSEFVSFVSHELKNPMTSIKGYTELLAAGAVGPINEAQHNFLFTIRSNVDRMATLVSDLADESRIEAGRLRLDFEAVSLKGIFDEVIRSEGKLMEEKQLFLSLEMDDELPRVWADHTRLVQVISNLLSNARKYTPEQGHIRVHAEAGSNQWDKEGAPEVVLVSIKDDGLGMKMEDQERIFQKFFRSDDVKTREVPGTGLGLNISKSLVEAQGGRIWFESEFRKGTTFFFTIPVAQN